MTQSLLSLQTDPSSPRLGQENPQRELTAPGQHINSGFSFSDHQQLPLFANVLYVTQSLYLEVEAEYRGSTQPQS